MKKLFLALALVVVAGCSSTTTTTASRPTSPSVNLDQTVERIEVYNAYTPADR